MPEFRGFFFLFLESFHSPAQIIHSSAATGASGFGENPARFIGLSITLQVIIISLHYRWIAMAEIQEPLLQPPQPINLRQRILDPEWGMRESQRVGVSSTANFLLGNLPGCVYSTNES